MTKLSYDTQSIYFRYQYVRLQGVDLALVQEQNRIKYMHVGNDSVFKFTA